MSETAVKKTGATPEIEALTEVQGPKVHGVAKVEAFIVQYTEGRFGETAVRLGFRIGDEIRFLEAKALTPPAQEWLTKSILGHLEKGKK